MADYLVETHKGHYITYDEVMQILQKAEDNGFVHQITNIDGENKIFAICNCNVNVCNALRTSQLFNTPNMSRSRLCSQGGKGKLRGLWALRGVLPRRCGEAGPKAVYQERAVSFTRGRNCPTPPSGGRRSGPSTTATRTASTATTPAPPPARRPAPPTSRCRAT